MDSPQRREVFKLGVVDLGVERAFLPNGVTVDLAIVRHPGAAAVVAVDAAGKLAMVRQYRHAIGQWMWEIPAGCRERGEEGRQCAERELREEVGARADQWDKLGEIVTIPSICDERIELYLARGLSLDKRHLDHDEVMETHWIELNMAMEMIGRGEVIDAKTICALHLAWPRLTARSAPAGRATSAACSDGLADVSGRWK